MDTICDVAAREQKRIPLQLDVRDYERAAAYAADEGISFAALVRQLIKAYIKRRLRGGPPESEADE